MIENQHPGPNINDIVVAGGGIAGLALALAVRQAWPGAAIAVCDPRLVQQPEAEPKTMRAVAVAAGSRRFLERTRRLERRCGSRPAHDRDADHRFREGRCAAPRLPRFRGRGRARRALRPYGVCRRSAGSAAGGRAAPPGSVCSARRSPASARRPATLAVQTTGRRTARKAAGGSRRWPLPAARRRRHPVGRVGLPAGRHRGHDRARDPAWRAGDPAFSSRGPSGAPAAQGRRRHRAAVLPGVDRRGRARRPASSHCPAPRSWPHSRTGSGTNSVRSRWRTGRAPIRCG